MRVGQIDPGTIGYNVHDSRPFYCIAKHRFNV